MIQMIGLYFNIVKKQKKSIILFSSIFMIILISFPYANKNRIAPNTFQGTKVHIAYIDQDHTNMSKAMRTFLEKSVRIQDIGERSDAQKDALFFQYVSTIIRVPKGFTEAFQAGNPMGIDIQQKPNDMRANIAVEQITRYLKTLDAFQTGYPNTPFDRLDTMVNEHLLNTVDVQLQETKKEMSTFVVLSLYFNFLSYILLSLIIMVEGITMHSIFKSEVCKRSVVSPLKSTQMSMGLILGNLSLGIVLWACYILAIIVLEPKGMLTLTGAMMAGNALLFVFVCIALAFLFTTLFSKFVNGREAINGATNIVGLCFSFQGGAFVPLYLIPEKVIVVSQFVPTYWFVKLNNTLVDSNPLASTTLQQLFITYGILLLFALAFLGIALAITKSRRSQGVLIDTM